MDARTPAKSLPADRRTSRSGPHQSAKSPTTITSPPKQWSGKAKSKSRNREKLSKSERQLSGGSKKANMNYLLGFQYEHARESNHHRSGSYSGRSPPQRTTRTSSAPRSKPLTREQYLQANAHFDVTQDCDLNVQLVDADIPVPWDQVVQVHLKTTQPQHCPICLAPPTAAKITRCGHVYCWPCIQHHLLLSEDAWADCPLCDDAVYARDLRPVCIAQVVQPKVDGALRFRLMRCQKGSSLAHPADLFAKLPQHTAVFDAQATNTPFLRYHRLSAADQHRIYAREAAELLTLQALEGDDPFVQSTSETLRKQWLALHPTQPATATLADLCSLPAPAQSPSPAVTGLELGPKPAVSKPAALNVHAPVFVPGGDSSDSLPFASADASVPSVQDVNGAAASMVEANVRVDDTGEEALYFYQAADGHAVFLSGINHKMLEQAAYGARTWFVHDYTVSCCHASNFCPVHSMHTIHCPRIMVIYPWLPPNWLSRCWIWKVWWWMRSSANCAACGIFPCTAKSIWRKSTSGSTLAPPRWRLLLTI
eukprot:TRINITY_DN10889_c0_g1_i5.p1 TRINITY_DN10889_c0_g1~~TRINITY_DN10889_c0_g1_i5.p1  ORF type:complete len:538 (+),score=91.05 TRINITY_DN10889_c0_g1_i5:301-1914(+)